MEVISKIEEELQQPLATELSGEQMEWMRRQQIARENAQATDRIQSLFDMPRGAFN